MELGARLLLQTKLRAVAKSSRGKLDEFQYKFCDDQDPGTGEDTGALGRVLIEDWPVPTFPLSMWNPASCRQDLAAEVALAKHASDDASDGRYIMLIAQYAKLTSALATQDDIAKELRISTVTLQKAYALIAQKITKRNPGV